MLEEKLKALSLRDLVDIISRVVKERDDVSESRKSGLRLMQFVYYPGERVIQDLVGVADWRDVSADEVEKFREHFADRLVQAGTCDTCGVEMVSYSKSAICPVCARNVECT